MMNQRTGSESQESRRVSKTRKVRELCIQALYQYYFRPEALESILTLHWLMGKNPPRPEVQEAFRKQFLLLIEHMDEIEKYLREFTIRDIDEIKEIDKAILHYALYQVFFTQEAHALLIHESIELAKFYSGVDAHKFIHKVLALAIEKKIQGKNKKNISF